MQSFRPKLIPLLPLLYTTPLAFESYTSQFKKMTKNHKLY